MFAASLDLSVRIWHHLSRPRLFAVSVFPLSLNILKASLIFPLSSRQQQSQLPQLTEEYLEQLVHRKEFATYHLHLSPFPLPLSLSFQFTSLLIILLILSFSTYFQRFIQRLETMLFGFHLKIQIDKRSCLSLSEGCRAA